MDSSVRIGTLELANPIIIASGPPGINGAAIKRMALGGPGAIVTKSIGIRPSPGQRMSLSYWAPNKKSLVLTDLWSTYSIEDWCGREIGIAREGGVPVIASLQAVTNTPAEDTFQMAGMVVDAGADAIELSAFGASPNAITGSGIGAVQDPRRTFQIVRAARAAVKVPIIAKLSPEPSNLLSLIEACEAGGADAIASRDSIFPAIAFDIHTRRPKVARTFGTWMPEVAGRAIHENAVGYVLEIFKRSRLPIIGIGGVMIWEDAVEMIIAGATAVGICTAPMIEGPQGVHKMVAGLTRYLKEQHVTLEELRGSGLEGLCQVNAMAEQPLHVLVDRATCNGCGLCVPVCPVQAISQSDDSVQISDELCIACAFCVHHCAREALSLAAA
jgi:dihydroorotate dehydrogenase (fumarate)